MTDATAPLAVPLLQSALLATLPQIAHGFSGRHGGVSEGDLASLNVGSRVHDHPQAVHTNRQRLLEAIERPQARWVSLRQVHGTDVMQVTHSAGERVEADGLWTRDRAAAIAVLSADCLPILLADRQGRLVAAVHAGWRGTCANIVGVMLQRLQDVGVAASQLVAALGPAIGPCCFEVGPEVVHAVTTQCAGAQGAITPRGERHMVDLWRLVTRQLTDAGMPPDAIDVLRVCTRCSPDYFSYRRDGDVTGRQAAVVALR